ncbi:uncharacterized protein [Bos indicus]|uniref:Uncharacterized protein isoform X1 n=1 Tax=Bos indicus TaxID=9915 RepID=A0ABM4SQ16_BOSIN|nr:uncharacterized protein LOC112447447 isoform X1 [Bos taurus]
MKSSGTLMLLISVAYLFILAEAVSQRGSQMSQMSHFQRKQLFAAIMRKQLQMENPVPRLTNQYVALTDKLTTTSVNSAKQLRKEIGSSISNMKENVDSPDAAMLKVPTIHLLHQKSLCLSSLHCYVFPISYFA